VRLLPNSERIGSVWGLINPDFCEQPEDAQHNKMHQRIEEMATNYISIARENRQKALSGLRQNRRQESAVSDCAVYVKSSRRAPEAVFMSSRNVFMFAQANFH